MTLIISGPQVVTEKGILNDASVVIQHGMISAINSKPDLSKKAYHFPANYYLVPGFIDLHIHGANGSDVMDGNQEALATISKALAAEGTTSFLATTMTADTKEIEKVLRNVRDFARQQNNFTGAKILGVHLEGPFLSPKKVGAQRADKILMPNIEYIQHWQTISDNIIKLVTLAPELPNSQEFIRYLKQKNIIAAIGHTDATYAETVAAIAAGCSHATHLFNAMRGIHQREPGAVTAALLSDAVMGELIVDGVHLHPAIVELALKLKSKNNLVLVTDAMRAKCLGEGVYDLGGQTVEVKKGIAQLEDGTLAGSVLQMSTAIKNMLQFTQCTLADAVQMAAENPAKELGIFAKKGSIASGKEADLVVLDEKLNVVLTLCGGQVVYQNVDKCESVYN